MKNYIYSLLFFSVFLSVSCEKDADIETPSQTPKLVIHSFICPDDTVLKVHVSTTRNIFGAIKDYPKSVPATVVMFDGEEAVEFSPLNDDGFYYSKHKIFPDKEYRLMVKCPGYPDAKASCKVPQVKNLFIRIDTTSEFIEYYYDPSFPKGPLSPDGFYDQKVSVQFSDIAGETNFYNVMAFQTYEHFKGIQTEVLYLENQNDNNNDFYYGYSSNKVLTDKMRDGKEFQLTFRNSYIKNDTAKYSVDLNALVMETDAAYYKYHSSLNTYTGTDEPFTEYSPVYTNIEGGFGIFASYIKYKKVLKIK